MGGADWPRVSGAPFAESNHAPSAVDDAVATAEDSSIAIAVLGNDGDADNDAISVSAAGAPGHGSATVNPDGTITYVPAADFHGEDSFSYTIIDGQGGSASAPVTPTASA